MNSEYKLERSDPKFIIPWKYEHIIQEIIPFTPDLIHCSVDWTSKFRFRLRKYTLLWLLVCTLGADERGVVTDEIENSSSERIRGHYVD